MHLSMSKLFLGSLVVAALGAPPVAAAPSACGEDAVLPNKNVPANAIKVQIPIDGMSCEGCATAIHNALLKIEGVYLADVTYANGKAVIAFDGAKTQVGALVKAIEDAGFKAGTPTGG